MLWTEKLRAALLAALMAAIAEVEGHMSMLHETCSMAEFTCRTESNCVPLDRYCDGVKDCDDGSDEPSGCTPCNRTYYGRLGSTYTIQVVKPPKTSLPYFCQLTFIASGFIYGDLVQLRIEKLNLGRFLSHTKEGCPDGHMQIEELKRPLGKGYWCGTSLGANTYYSETSLVTIMIRMFNYTESISNPGQGSNVQDSVILKLSYRFLQRHKANLRYGMPYKPHFRGKDISNTFCDKYFEQCDKENCKVQSPNFPGMYPRNLTCYYYIKQKEAPAGKVPLIRVRQSNQHLIYIKDINVPDVSREQRLYLNDDCHVIHDFMLIFDGNNTQAPSLLKACKGGTLSPVTSSGSELLIMFHASAFDFPYQASPVRKVFGFSLDVEVVFVDIESTGYVKKNQSTYPCQWTITSRGQRSGYIQAPVHSLLANTTCTWRLIALPSEVVWLYFLHYKNIPHEEIPPPKSCPNTLRIYDGDSALENATLLKRVCQKDKYPRVCSGVHAIGAPVSCSLEESYVSSSKKLSVSLYYAVGTIPAHVEFLARYEFVSRRQWGRGIRGAGPCDRIFGHQPSRLFASPRDVFLYGRGGNRQLKCTYTFKVETHQRLLIRILRSKMGDHCSTIFRQTSKKHDCSHKMMHGEPSITFVEKLWDDIDMNRGCICNTADANPFSLTSYTNEIKLIFDVPRMAADHDFTTFFFEGDYEIIDGPVNFKGERCREETRIHSERHGNFTIGAGGLVDPCSSLPRLVTAFEWDYLFMRIKGLTATNTNCGAASRVNVYSAGDHSPLISICPEPVEIFTNVFSYGWNMEEPPTYNNSYHSSYIDWRRKPPMSRDMIIEYIGNYSGRIFITWVGVWQIVEERGQPTSQPLSKCPHTCPGIQACLPPELWCDGHPHCPSEIDEGVTACGLLLGLPWASLVAAGALVFSLVFLLLAVIVHKISKMCRNRRKRVTAPKTTLPFPNSKTLKRTELLDSPLASEKDGAW